MKQYNEIIGNAIKYIKVTLMIKEIIRVIPDNLDKRVSSIMIEVNRKLYLTKNYEKNKNFGNIQMVISKDLKILEENHKKTKVNLC